MFSLIPAVIALSIGLSATAHPLRNNAAAARHHGVSLALRADEKLADPEGWATGYLEDYTTYHNRYLAIDCDDKHDTEFWDKCCHPMLATETLDRNRDPECNPANASSSGSSKSDNNNDDEEDCEEEEDDSHDSESQKTQSAPKTSSKAAAAAAATPDAPKSSSAQKEEPKPTSTKKEEDPKPTSTKKEEESKTSSSQASQETPKSDSGSDNKGGNSGSNSFTGQFTWYKQGGNPGNCGDYHGDGDLIGAMNTAQYDGGSVCGKYIQINADNGKSVRVQIVDSCPGCGWGDVDLSTGSFAKLAEASVGVVKGGWSWA